MTDETDRGSPDDNNDGDQQQQQRQQQPDNTVQLGAARDEGVVEGRRLENERRTQITDLVLPFERQLGEGFVEFRDGLLTGDTSLEDARALLLAEIGKQSSPAGGDSVRVTETESEKFRDAAKIALQLRAGLIDPGERESLRTRR